MDVLRGVLRVYSWIFETILCLMAVGVATVTKLSGDQNLKLGWLPWTGNSLTTWMICLGLVGLLCVVLAVLNKGRTLLFLFSVFVLGLLVKGFFIGFGYSFENPGQATNAAYLCGGALLAVVGAWPFHRTKNRR